VECTPLSKDSKGVREYLRCLQSALKGVEGVGGIALVDNGAKYSMVLYVEVKNVEVLDKIMELVRESAGDALRRVVKTSDSTYIFFGTNKEALILRLYVR